MKHELIDWYDENGNYKGIIDKEVAHRKGLWHKSVHVWVINDNDEILMQKRCAQKNFFPNFWDCSFAGHVAAGESSFISALREGEEELGLKLKEEELNFVFTIKEQFKWRNIISNEIVDVYLVYKNINMDDLTYQKEEVEQAKFVKIEELFNSKEKILPHNEEYKRLIEILNSSKEIE